MQLHELIPAQAIRLGFDPGDKWNAVRLLVEALVEADQLAPELEASVRELVEDRERSMSTGMEEGLAVPHATVPGLSQVVGALGVVPEGATLDFDAIDGLPTRLVVLLLIPAEQKMLHIRTLAEVARVLGDAAVRDAVLGAAQPAEAHAALHAAAQA
jgi:PTS system nitrogen regulatory IIA component